MHFPNNMIFDFKIYPLIHYTSLRDEINCVDISKDFAIMYHGQIFKNNKFKYINFIYNENLSHFW